MDPRIGTCARETGETRVQVRWNLDGVGASSVSTGVGFLDHMLTLVAHHGLFDMDVETSGDLYVDAHHTIEDTAIGLGTALQAAVGDARGIVRMAHAFVPMDEALVLVAVDLSGRPFTAIDLPLSAPMIGTFPAGMVEHFFSSLASAARCNVHVRMFAGTNEHHVVEAAFKAFARALHAASRIDARRGDQVPSTKGVL